MSQYNVTKVIYSPIKAFQEILGNPKIRGPVIIIIISLILTMGTHYISASKHHIETITPTNRTDWTNTTSIWASNTPPENITIVENTDNVLVGNYSIQALISNNTEIWLKTTNIGTINCSQNGGFITFYYKLFYLNLMLKNASTATLRLYSLKNESNYFEFDLQPLTRKYLNISMSWMDANISLADSGWVQVGSPHWENITGIEFKLAFYNQTKLALRLNDLYFGGKYQPLFDAVGFTGWLTSTLMSSVVDLLLRWLILAGLLWLTIRTFNPQGSPFKTLLIIVGYTFVTTFILVPINALTVSQLPSIYFPNRFVFPSSTREFETAHIATSNIYTQNWTSTTPYIAFTALWYISYAWTTLLCTIAVKPLQNFSWKKAAIISVVAIIMSLFISAMVSSFLAI